MPKLGVNVDHIATLRQARGGREPDPVYAAFICEKAGCDSIVAHLREDRRHINDDDIEMLRKKVTTRLNLEMSINPEIVRIACRIRPDQATLVPEKRKERTTEGGICVTRDSLRLGRAIGALHKKGVEASVFIEPDNREISAAKKIGAGIIEIHTGRYSDAKNKRDIKKEFLKIKDSCEFALSLGMEVNAGHGLDYKNARQIAMINGMNELNIGYSIISRAVFVGLFEAVREMRRLVEK